MRPAPDAAGSLRANVLRILGTTLGDEIVLAHTTRLYHWNVVGPQFPYLHPFFHEQHQQLDALADEVAERVRQLGGVIGTLSAVVASARLRERPAPQPAAKDMIALLLADHEALIGQLRDDAVICGERLHDRVTMTALVGWQARHEQMARLLRALLEAPTGESGGK
jgi:starvation-inducible DNA-binding protein